MPVLNNQQYDQSSRLRAVLGKEATTSQLQNKDEGANVNAEEDKVAYSTAV